MPNNLDRFVLNGDVEIMFNDPEFVYDSEYLQEPVIRRFGSIESDGGIEDYGNCLLEM